MSQNLTESKPLLSHVIAEWACALKYEDLSPAAIQAAGYFGAPTHAAVVEPLVRAGHAPLQAK